MTAADPASLSNLRGLALPSPVSWWPPQPGWWIVLVGLLAIFGFAAQRVLQAYRANAYRRAAIRELEALAAKPAVEMALPMVSLLKRVALAAYPRSEVAGLTGADWSAFLGPGAEQWMGALRRASVDRRAPLSDQEARDAVKAVRHWIEHHRRDGAQ